MLDTGWLHQLPPRRGGFGHRTSTFSIQTTSFFINIWAAACSSHMTCPVHVKATAKKDDWWKTSWAALTQTEHIIGIYMPTMNNAGIVCKLIPSKATPQSGQTAWKLHKRQQPPWLLCWITKERKPELTKFSLDDMVYAWPWPWNSQNFQPTGYNYPWTTTLPWWGSLCARITPGAMLSGASCPR